MNVRKFNSKNKPYAKARPYYPQALFNYLNSRSLINADTAAADIGSGTGIFTGQLSPFVKKIYAVEPNYDMRTEAEGTFTNYHNIISVNATAEKTSLPDNSINLITSAQAFHWFDRSAFKSECRRILKHGGDIVLVWNDRDVTFDIIQENFAVNKSFCPNFRGSSNGMNFSKDSFNDFFEGEFDIIEFENSIIYDIDTFISRNLSSSYAPRECESTYKDYIGA